MFKYRTYAYRSEGVSTSTGPSWAWFYVTLVSGVGTLVLILLTTCVLWARGYLVS